MAHDGGQRRCGRCLVQHGQKCVGHEGRDHRLLLFCQTHGATSSVLLPFSSFIWLAFVYLVIRPSGYLATWLPGCPAAQPPSYPGRPATRRLSACSPGHSSVLHFSARSKVLVCAVLDVWLTSPPSVEVATRCPVALPPRRKAPSAGPFDSLARWVALGHRLRPGCQLLVK